MAIIDSQAHAYEANTPKRPWKNVPNRPPSATGDELVAASPSWCCSAPARAGVQVVQRERWVDADQTHRCGTSESMIRSLR